MKCPTFQLISFQSLQVNRVKKKKIIALLTQLIDYIDNCKKKLYYKFPKLLGLNMQIRHYLKKYALICIIFSTKLDEVRFKILVEFF